MRPAAGAPGPSGSNQVPSAPHKATTPGPVAAPAPPPGASQWIDLPGPGPGQRIEYLWVGTAEPSAPLWVFLHEGLGSVAMWSAFAQRLCQRLGARGLVYSRPGYGRSSPRPPTQKWAPDYMHQQAHSLLPALLAALAIDPKRQPVWLLGHSDGASIALLYAAQSGATLRGLVAMAPHVFVEPVALQRIAAARRHYLHGDLRARLAAYHDDPDSAFWGWNRAWLNPAFVDWRIDQGLQAICCPLLLVQGENDEYGSLAQLDAIEARVAQAQRRVLADCRHSPHRDQEAALTEALLAFSKTQNQAGDGIQPSDGGPIGSAAPAPKG